MTELQRYLGEGNKTSLKLRYNATLAATRKLEDYLNDNTHPYEERLAFVEEYKALVAVLLGILRDIGPHTEQEVEMGFSVNSVNSVNTVTPQRKALP